MVTQTWARNALNISAPSGPWGQIDPLFLAQKSDDGRTLVLRVVNFNSKIADYMQPPPNHPAYPVAPQTALTVRLTGTMASRHFSGATIWVLQSDDPAAANPPGQPALISPVRSTLPFFGDATVLQIPANSYVVVVAKLATDDARAMILKSDDDDGDELPGVYTFGGGTDACSQQTAYCKSRISCAGVKGGQSANEVLVLNHTLSSTGAKLGVVDHFWHVGPSALAQAEQGLQIEVRYYVDGETEPSIVFDPLMATGQGFGTVEQDGKIVDATALVGDDGLWHAGSKMGKSGLVSADWHHHPILFQRSIYVTQAVRCLNETRCASAPQPANHYPGLGCVAGTVIIQGHEQSKPLTLRSGFTLPLSARMRLIKIEDKDFAPREFVPLANISAGNVALLYLVSMSLQASPPWAACADADCSQWKGGINNYVEGCWHLLRTHDEALPGLITGTGLEGGLDTSYAFGLLNRTLTGLNVECRNNICPRQGKLWQTANTGALHFSADRSATAKARYPGTNVFSSEGGVERISAYRFFDEQVMGGNDGMIYGWRNGAFGSGDDVPTGGYGGKCIFSGHKAGRDVGITTVKSYAWVFVWPKKTPGSKPMKNDDILHVEATADKCSSRANCSLGGECTAGRCACYPTWRGPNCTLLNLLPANVTVGPLPGVARGLPAAWARPGVQSSWGGRPILDEATGRWHLYAADMSERCGLHAWTTNSAIAHATASSAAGPFSEVEGE
jgi:hypothetical protein